MGKYAWPGKNEMLDALGALETHTGLLEADAAIATVTGAASTDLFTKVGHGLSNGDLVILTEMSGGTGLKAGDADNADDAALPYYVVGVAGNDFQVSRVSGGTAVNFTSDVTDVKVTRLVEITGGSPAYARQATAFGAAADGSMAMTGTETFDIPAGATVNYHAAFSASTAGTLYQIDKVTAEGPYGAQGTYTVNTFAQDLKGDE